MDEALAAARLLEVSASTGVKWAQQWRATGKLSAKAMGGKRPVILEAERDWLLSRLERKCEPTLADLVAALHEDRGVLVCRDTLWRFLKRCGKSFSSPASKTGPMSRAAARAGSPGTVSNFVREAIEMDRKDHRYGDRQGRIGPAACGT